MNKQNRDTQPTQEEVIKMLESGELITRFEKMIYKIVHGLLKVHPNEVFDELLSEAYWGIVQDAPKYDPAKARLSTWIYQAAYYSAKTYCINTKNQRYVPTELEDPIFERAEAESWLSVFLRGLGEDAALLITSILEAPGELSEVIRDESPRKIRRAITKQLKRTLGYSTAKWNRAWQEIKTNL